jgi:hypothetical protein
MNISEKTKIYHNVWNCAYQRRHAYKGTSRELREHETLLMCLNIAKWWRFDSEKPNYIRK